MQTVSLPEQLDRHFDIPDILKEKLQVDNKKKDCQERILNPCDPYNMKSMLKNSSVLVADGVFIL